MNKIIPFDPVSQLSPFWTRRRYILSEQAEADGGLMPTQDENAF